MEFVQDPNVRETKHQVEGCRFSSFRLQVLAFWRLRGARLEARRPRRDDTSLYSIIEAGNGFVAFDVKFPEDFSWANGIDAQC